MGRLHVFELEDQPWFPDRLRTAMTDYLSQIGNLSPVFYRRFATILARALKRTGDTRLLDLCSGGSGPVESIRHLLATRHELEVDVLLTDLYPNLARFEYAREQSDGHIDFHPEPVDATAVPSELSGFRLITNGLHHFRPEMAKSIIADAVRQSQGIAVLEVVSRTPGGFLQIAGVPLTVFMLTPFMRPFRLDRLLLTYTVPLLPALILFDGFMSALRIYSPDELRELVADLPANHYEWDIGTLPLPVGRLTYLVGTPPV